MFQVVVENLAFPEGALWSARDGCIYFTEWLGDRVWSLRDGRVQIVFATPPGSGPSGLGQDPAGNFWLCLYSGQTLAQSPQPTHLLRSM